MKEAAFSAVAKKTVRLGKKEPKVIPGTPQLHHYLTPTSKGFLGIGSNVARRVARAHYVTDYTRWGMMLNDNEGDCTVAALGHAEMLWSAVVSAYQHTPGANITIPSDSEINAFYYAINGGVDEGAYLADACNKFLNDGLHGSKIEAFAQIGVQDVDTIKRAIDIFGVAYVGVALPVTAQGQNVWSVVRNAGTASDPGSWGGHAIPLIGYTSEGPTCVTWGETLRMSWNFWATYGDEAYALVSPLWFESTGKTIEGFDYAGLVAAMNQISV